MRPIPKEHVASIIYVFDSVAAAERGDIGGGTGFLYSVPGDWKNAPRHFFAFTNAHVAVNARAIRLKRADGTSLVWPINQNDWHEHESGDDVAVAYLNRELLEGVPSDGLQHTVLIRRDNVVLGDEERRVLDPNVWTGAPCVLLGRVVAQCLQPSNNPIARFGTVSSHTLSPIFQNMRGRMQESLVVEVRSLSSYSGSPVFMGPLNTLLGINWAHLTMTQEVWRRLPDGRTARSGEFIEMSIGQAGVVPAWKLTELLNSPGVKAIRERASEADAAALKERLRLRPTP